MSLNYDLPYLPERTAVPRESGLTMVMDKGLSLREAENMLDSSADFIDMVKLGFGTSIVTKNLKEKIALYKRANIKVYFGGTLFEAFYVRNALNDYQKFMDQFGVEMVEVSDGSIVVAMEEKCHVIQSLAKDYLVISEVGSKEEGIFISPAKWIKMMQSELDAGSWQVIAEARESGTVGIYRPNGTAHSSLINKILAKIPNDKILWEAPKKSQQVYFIQTMGHNVNLGNIAPNEVIPLECLRLGLRGDTFFNSLPEGIVEKFH